MVHCASRQSSYLNFLLYNRRESGRTAQVTIQHQSIQTAVEQQDQGAQATADMTEYSVQVPEETAERATLTDVSNTTGTLSTDTQTEFDMADSGHQHGSSYNDFIEAGTGTDPYTTKAAAEALYKLTDFAIETNGTLHLNIRMLSYQHYDV